MIIKRGKLFLIYCYQLLKNYPPLFKLIRFVFRCLPNCMIARVRQLIHNENQESISLLLQIKSDTKKILREFYLILKRFPFLFQFIREVYLCCPGSFRKRIDSAIHVATNTVVIKEGKVVGSNFNQVVDEYYEITPYVQKILNMMSNKDKE